MFKTKLYLFLLFTTIFTLNILAQDEAEKQGKEIFDKYQAAIGGKENWDKIKTVETITESERMGTKYKTIRIEDKVNKKSYIVTEGGIEGKRESGFDGKRNWSKNNSFRGYNENTSTRLNETVKHFKLPNEKIDGKEYLVVNEISSSGSMNAKAYYDPETYLLYQKILNLNVGGRKIEQTTIYSDYRKIGDVLVAFKEVMKTSNGDFTNQKISVRHNIEIDPKIFEYNETEKNFEKISDKKIEAENIKPEYDRFNPDAVVPENVKKETLEKVWSTINNSHFDPTFNGVDWNAVKIKYEAQLSNIKTNQNLTDLLNRMVGELKQSHLKIHPASVVAVNGVAPTDAPKTGSIGLDLRLINQSELVITNVAKDSTAEKAGLKKGYVIKKVDGETVESIAQKQKEKGGFQLRDELTVPRAVQARLAGNLEKKVTVTFLDENDAEKTIEIDRQSLGARVLDFEFKELNKDVGYIRFNLFFGDLPAKFAEAIAQLKDKKSIIVDIRGNRGGVGNLTITLAAMLDKEKRSLGVSQYRYNKQEFLYEGNDKSFTGKVFILIDEMSASSAEILAAGLQSHKRATVIGRTSVGAVLPSTTELLPNGGALQYAIADYKTPDGKVLEGRGAIPDLEVKLTRKDLLAGKDLVLETALKLAK